MNQKGARTKFSNPKHNDFKGVMSPDDMVGPSATGKCGLSSSQIPNDLREGQVDAVFDTNKLPAGLAWLNDHDEHVSIYPARDMKFSEYQTLLNGLGWEG
ncbi:hypothetical protein QCE63_21045 [Caballeronia sp. LZ065]|uniref:hypothetical protein n=1 Tax=Caballeronia sp. LZ065 TaxID=3038571 RepID=UPI00285EA4E1|nr:hypothetical protein [Caballeronia sp. LZ065]MDR5781890.1 hypothetical protein [Caballeronia sp. LZ065]